MRSVSSRADVPWLAAYPHRTARSPHQTVPTNPPESAAHECRLTETSRGASARSPTTKARKETDGHLVVVSELGPSIEVIETPMSGFEMDGEGWRKVLGRIQEVVNVAREVVVGHRRRRWRGGDNGPTPSGTHGSSCRPKAKKRWLCKHHFIS